MKTVYAAICELIGFQVADRCLNDGVYDVSGIEVLHLEVGMNNEVLPDAQELELTAFIAKYKDTFRVGNGSGTNNMFILSHPPFGKIDFIGCGFEGHGTSVLFDVPYMVAKILILGEND